MPPAAGTILVTGGAGFIGSHLVDSLLADGHAVRVLDDLSTGRRAQVDPRAEFVAGDVADPAVLLPAMHGVSAVFHLAAIASVARANEDWPGTHRTNLSATVAVLDAARAGGRIPVVYASSAAVYGDASDGPADEARPPAPLTAYGADKLGCELHARVGTLVHGVPTLGLRFFNVYGPRQDPASPYSGVISIFARRVAEGLPVTLHGDGLQTRDFVHVADVVAHLRAAWRGLAGAEARRLAGRAFNVCTGRVVAVRDLALLLGRLSGREAIVVAGPARPGDIRHSRGNPEAAVKALGVRARIMLDEGLRSVVAPVREVVLP